MSAWVRLSHAAYGAFNHERSRDAEEEYDRLRNLARQEAQKRNECFDRVRHIQSTYPRPED